MWLLLASCRGSRPHRDHGLLCPRGMYTQARPWQARPAQGRASQVAPSQGRREGATAAVGMCRRGSSGVLRRLGEGERVAQRGHMATVAIGRAAASAVEMGHAVVWAPERWGVR